MGGWGGEGVRQADRVSNSIPGPAGASPLPWVPLSLSLSLLGSPSTPGSPRPSLPHRGRTVGQDQPPLSPLPSPPAPLGARWGTGRRSWLGWGVPCHAPPPRSGCCPRLVAWGGGQVALPATNKVTLVFIPRPPAPPCTRWHAEPRPRGFPSWEGGLWGEWPPLWDEESSDGGVCPSPPPPKWGLGTGGTCPSGCGLHCGWTGSLQAEPEGAELSWEGGERGFWGLAPDFGCS